MKQKSILLLIFALAAALALAACGGPSYDRSQVDELAKCLSENDVKMYGAFWCPHCARVKKMFGSSFQHVNYVECDPRGDNEQAEHCIEKGIEEYATFEFADGSRLVGEPSFEELAAKSGCTAPTAQ